MTRNRKNSQSEIFRLLRGNDVQSLNNIGPQMMAEKGFEILIFDLISGSRDPKSKLGHRAIVETIERK